MGLLGESTEHVGVSLLPNEEEELGDLFDISSERVLALDTGLFSLFSTGQRENITRTLRMRIAEVPASHDLRS
jgi:hypothetical protein